MQRRDDADIQNYEWTEKLVNVLQAFRTVHPEISANHMLTLLHIYREPGISQKALSKHLDVANGTAARLCAVLSERGNRGTKGLALVEIGHQPDDYRTSAQRLSVRGRRLMNLIRDTMSLK